MKLYIACHDQKRARKVANRLNARGFEIVSGWLNESFGKCADFDEETRWRFANDNFADVRRCDTLVLIAGPEKYSGGKFVEAGFAYALGKHVVIMGRRENMQCYGFHMKQVGTVSELCAALEVAQ